MLISYREVVHPSHVRSFAELLNGSDEAFGPRIE
jgi:hypothetical protein